MLKIYFLSTCDTCTKILKMFQPLTAFELQDIKTWPITVEQLEEMRAKVGSYGELINRRAQIIKQADLNVDQLSEDQLKFWILKEYTLLKRPVIIIGEHYFFGNQTGVVEKALNAWQEYQLQRI